MEIPLQNFPDGKVWRAAVQSEPIADRSTVYKNPFRNVWVYSMRHNVRVDANKLVRARDYNENTDPEAGTKKAEALLSAFWFWSCGLIAATPYRLSEYSACDI